MGLWCLGSNYMVLWGFMAGLYGIMGYYGDYGV